MSTVSSERVTLPATPAAITMLDTFAEILRRNATSDDSSLPQAVNE